jgi:hypothetical protein
MTVHLVNLTNPMMMKGPFRELIPVGEQQVHVRLPEGTRARRVRLLAANKTPQTNRERTGQHLTVHVPSVLDHEVVAIDLMSSLEPRDGHDRPQMDHLAPHLQPHGSASPK